MLKMKYRNFFLLCTNIVLTLSTESLLSGNSFLNSFEFESIDAATIHTIFITTGNSLGLNSAISFGLNNKESAILLVNFCILPNRNFSFPIFCGNHSNETFSLISLAESILERGYNLVIAEPGYVFMDNIYSSTESVVDVLSFSFQYENGPVYPNNLKGIISIRNSPSLRDNLPRILEELKPHRIDIINFLTSSNFLHHQDMDNFQHRHMLEGIELFGKALWSFMKNSNISLSTISPHGSTDFNKEMWLKQHRLWAITQMNQSTASSYQPPYVSILPYGELQSMFSNTLPSIPTKPRPYSLHTELEACATSPIAASSDAVSVFEIFRKDSNENAIEISDIDITYYLSRAHQFPYSNSTSNNHQLPAIFPTFLKYSLEFSAKIPSSHALVQSVFNWCDGVPSPAEILERIFSANLALALRCTVAFGEDGETTFVRPLVTASSSSNTSSNERHPLKEADVTDSTTLDVSGTSFSSPEDFSLSLKWEESLLDESSDSLKEATTNTSRHLRLDISFRGDGHILGEVMSVLAMGEVVASIELIVVPSASLHLLTQEPERRDISETQILRLGVCKTVSSRNLTTLAEGTATRMPTVVVRDVLAREKSSFDSGELFEGKAQTKTLAKVGDRNNIEPPEMRKKGHRGDLGYVQRLFSSVVKNQMQQSFLFVKSIVLKPVKKAVQKLVSILLRTLPEVPYITQYFGNYARKS